MVDVLADAQEQKALLAQMDYMVNSSTTASLQGGLETYWPSPVASLRLM